MQTIHAEVGLHCINNSLPKNVNMFCQPVKPYKWEIGLQW